MAGTAALVLAVSACGGGGGDAPEAASTTPAVRLTALREGVVAFTRDFGAGPRVYLLSMDGTGATPMFAPGRAQSAPDWSPSGELLAFDIGCGSNIAAVYRVAPKGKKAVSRAIPKGMDGCAGSWSPDGERLAFEGTTDGYDFDVWVASADGSSGHSLTGGPGSDRDPDWSPEGDRITFVSDRGGQDDLYVMGVDGRGVHVLYAGPGTERSPEWSPDGSQVVFASSGDDPCEPAASGCFDVYVMDADGGDVSVLVAGEGDDLDPTWSPDGSRILFSSDRDGDFDLYVVKADGTGTTQVTNDSGDDRSPSWGVRVQA